jgi:hypothetical protein
MGYQAQASQNTQITPNSVQANGGNVFYDSTTGQYYINQPATAVKENKPNPTGIGALFNLNNSKKAKTEKTYLPNYVSPANRLPMQHNYIDIAALFPELYQAATGMQGDSQASAGLLGQGAAQSASSGAGRFM